MGIQYFENIKGGVAEWNESVVLLMLYWFVIWHFDFVFDFFVYHTHSLNGSNYFNSQFRFPDRALDLVAYRKHMELTGSPSHMITTFCFSKEDLAPFLNGKPSKLKFLQWKNMVKLKYLLTKNKKNNYN